MWVKETVLAAKASRRSFHSDSQSQTDCCEHGELLTLLATHDIDMIPRGCVYIVFTELYVCCDKILLVS